MDAHKWSIYFGRYHDSYDGCDPWWAGGCDYYFRNIKIKTSKSGSTLWSYSSTSVTDDSSTANVGVRGTVSLPFGSSVYVSMDVWDEDIYYDDYIRYIGGYITIGSSANIGQWYGPINIYKSRAYLSVEYKLLSCENRFTGSGCRSCEQNYYGSGCSTYCRPVSGSYNCDSGGRKNCIGRKTGSDCQYCQTNYYPRGSCTVYCRPVSGSYTCDSNGKKNCIGRKTGSDCQYCQTNYYPRGSCTVYCIPVSGSYTCDSNGRKNCIGRKTGSDCQYCQTNYYPRGSCTVYCAATSGYTCTPAGDKLCKTNYYPDGQCDTFCDPHPGVYTCSTLGLRVPGKIVRIIFGFVLTCNDRVKCWNLKQEKT